MQTSQPSASGQGWWLEVAFFGCQQMLATLQVCSAGVGGIILRKHMAAEHLDPLELHSSPSPSGKKDPNTLEDPFKDHSGCVLPMWQQLDTGKNAEPLFLCSPRVILGAKG